MVSGVEAYKQITSKRNAIFTITFVMILLSLFSDLLVGSSGVSIDDVIKGLLEGPNGESIIASIIWNVRMPMTLICLCVGASLGLAGSQMQTILANPLASPYTLGVSSAAGFGAAMAFISGFPFGGGLSWINAPLLAFSMTLASTMLFTMLAELKVCRLSQWFYLA